MGPFCLYAICKNLFFYVDTEVNLAQYENCNFIKHKDTYLRNMTLALSKETSLGHFCSCYMGAIYCFKNSFFIMPVRNTYIVQEQASYQPALRTILLFFFVPYDRGQIQGVFSCLLYTSQRPRD